ncbi:MAG: hypothetical protein QE271_02330 [Bacteriovoracaceae bacterium]|nr:hypothetical protein [Bacteriovoracaceae bacterium]
MKRFILTKLNTHTIKIYLIVCICLINLFNLSIVLASKCGELKNFGQLTIKFDHQANSIEQYKLDEKKRRQQLKSFANNFFNDYMKGKIDNHHLELIEECYRDEEYQSINQEINLAFYNNTVEIIAKWGELSHKFSKLLENSNSIIKIYGHNKPVKNLNAGYDRGKLSIFMDITSIKPEEWPIHFIHEQVHALDKILRQSVIYFGDPEIVDEIESIINNSLSAEKSGENDCILTSSQKEIVSKWCQASFERGIKTQMRAWSISTLLYLEAMNNNKITKIPWIEEEFLSKENSHLNSNYEWSLKDFKINGPKYVMNLLLTNFKVNYGDVFSYPILKNEIKRIYEDMNNNPVKHIEFDSILSTFFEIDNHVEGSKKN